MVYKKEELSEYPICDTDIWIDIILAEIDNLLFEKYGKIVFADVVEQEIMMFRNNPTFQCIANKFMTYKEQDRIIVICHDRIDCIDKMLLEKQLKECNSQFKTGLKDYPHEEHKGEIVSAIYAEYFVLPFLKSNDGAFRDGNMGKISFPNLIVKDRKTTIYDLVDNEKDRKECLRKIKENRMFITEGQRIYEEEMNCEATQDDVDKLLRKLRSKWC